MAKKKLVIVESPAKAKTINKYLGKEYVVEASVGHIKDLNKFKLGVDIEKGFVPKYVTISGKAEIIKKLKQLSSSSEQVLIATDPDREGEAIAWHIAEEVKSNNENIKRVIFNEITKTGIKRGISEQRDIDENVFMSQQARRVMDRLIGFQISPFLSKAMLDKTSKTLSAGRVQSVALRLICEREALISNFKPIEYWSINAEFATETADIIKARLVSFDGNQIKNPEGSAKSEIEEEQKKIDEKLAAANYIKNEDQVKDLLKRVKSEKYKIADISKKQVKRKPSSPFTTSLLQQEASRRLGFSNKKTMQVAQKLYEGINLGDEGAVGLITYMRTDSVRISPDAQAAARSYIQTSYGNEYVPEDIPVYSSKSSNVQDAHEAVRPTSMDYAPSNIKKHLSKDEYALYELIFNRFLASQMSPAILDQTTVNIESNSFVFRASGSVIVFKGFLAIYDDIKEDKAEQNEAKESSTILPKNLKEKQDLDLKKADSNQSFTKPAPRYNEASLVKELDELGIGRPSTYAQIVSTLLDRKYVELVSKAFMPSELGVEVNTILVQHFPEIFNVDFTAEMEEELDLVAEGTKTYLDMLNDFYNPFSKSLKNAESQSDSNAIKCELCGGEMLIRVSRKGRFLGCSNYPDCSNTKPLPKGEMDAKEKKEPVIAEGVFCDECGSQMLLREGRFGKFYGCSAYPKCKGIKQIKSAIKCPKCNEGNLLERYSPKSKKKFWGCSRYPDCDYLTNYEPLMKDCAKCGSKYLEVRFKKVDDGYEKYLNCPSCKEKYPYEEKK